MGTSSNIGEIFDIFTAFIKTNKGAVETKEAKLKAHIDALYNYYIEFHRDFHLIPLNQWLNPEGRKKNIEQLLKWLEIPRTEYNKFLASTSTYELLKNLREKASSTRMEIDPLFHLIDQFTQDNIKNFLVELKIPAENHEHYLKSTSPFDLLSKLRKDHPNSEKFKHFDPLLSLLAADTSKQSIEEFLKQLSIKKEDCEEYLQADLTIYELLLKLSREHPRTRLEIDSIIKFIDSKANSQKWKLLGLGIATLATTIGALGTSRTIAITQSILTSPISFPIIGLVASIGLAAYTVYENYYNPRLSFWEKLRNNAFAFTQGLFNAASRVLWIAAATTAMTPLVAALAVAAVSVDVVKEVFELVRGYRKLVKNSLENFIDTIAATNKEELFLSEKLRKQSEYHYKHHAFAAGINLVAAAAIVGIVAIWSFFPPALAVTIACATAMAAVYAVKYFAINHNETRMKNNLHNELDKLENDYLGTTQQASQKIINEKLEKKEKTAEVAIKNEEKWLATSSDTLGDNLSDSSSLSSSFGRPSDDDKAAKENTNSFSATNRYHFYNNEVKQENDDNIKDIKNIKVRIQG